MSDLTAAICNDIRNANINPEDDDDESQSGLNELPTLEEIERCRPQNRSGMLVSGWDDIDDDVEEDVNPRENPCKEILWAAENGKVDIVDSLLKVDPNLVNVQDKDGYTPLHRACYGNHYDVAKRLLMASANPNAVTEYKWTPLHSACKWNNAECAALLLQYGSNVNALSDGGQTPLHIAAASSECRETLTLLLMNEEVNTKLVNVSGETAADIARRSGKYYYLFDIADDAIN